MDAVIQKADAAIRYMLGSPTPGQQAQKWVLLLLAVLTAVLVFGRMARLTQERKPSPMVILMVCLAGMVAMTFAVALLRSWVGALVPESLLFFVMTIIALVVSLLVVIPLMALAEKASGVSVLFSWTTSFFAAVCVVMIARTGMELFTSGSAGAQRTKDRSAEMQEFLNGQ